MKKYAGKGWDSIILSADTTLYAHWVGLQLTATDNYTDNSGKGAVNLRWSQADGLVKTYKLYQSLDKTNWKAINNSTSISESLSAYASYTSPGTYTYTVPYSGIYQLTSYGAQGGNYGSYTGGYGGATAGQVYLSKGEIITAYVGGQNGWNGGGSGSA